MDNYLRPFRTFYVAYTDDIVIASVYLIIQEKYFTRCNGGRLPNGRHRKRPHTWRERISRCPAIRHGNEDRCERL
jgi:hypothetical protein